MPFFSRSHTQYGGNTSCVRLDTGGHKIIFDCGSGLYQFYEDIEAELKSGKNLRADILISHLHLDHTIGLSTFSPIWNEKNDVRIYTKSRGDAPLATQVFGPFKPPYWPVELDKMCKAQMIEIYEEEPFTLERGIKVVPFISAHHNDTIAFRVEADKKFVYILDYELDGTADQWEVLIRHCKNADAIVFDTAYFPEDYPQKKGFGHSTYEGGMELAEAVDCGLMIFSHLSHDYSDAKLNTLKKKIEGNSKYIVAYDGMELDI